MTRDEELWGVELALMNRYGDQTEAEIGDRLRRMALAGDQEAVTTWTVIAARVDQLRDQGTQQ